MIRTVAALCVFCGALFAQQNPAQRPPVDPWQKLRFLIGTWQANTKGGSAGAAAAGAYTFRLELADHVLVRHVAGASCKGPADFNCEHKDVLYVYPDSAQSVKAIYFDNEGHVIHYDVTSPAPNTAVFLSEAQKPGPQFRLSYELEGRVMRGAFQIRAPGQSEFRSYLEWTGEKK